MSLDLGWSFGWCLLRRGGVVTSGVERLARNHPTDGLRLVAKRQWLTAKLTMLTRAGEKLTDIFYEEITFVGEDNGPTSMHAHGKQLGAVESWAALKGLPEPEGIPWNTVKKFVTGHGSASQQTMLKAIQRVFPDVTDHNQASAVGVMLTATNQKLPNPGSPHADRYNGTDRR